MEDVYIEESNPKKALLVVIMFLIIILIFIGLFINYRKKSTIVFKNTIKLEIGSELNNDINFYLKQKIKDLDNADIDLSNIPVKDGVLSEIGTFKIIVKYNNKSKSKNILVVDTKSPDVEVLDMTIGTGEEYDLNDFITKCEDYSKPCQVMYVKDTSADLSKNVGNYNFDIKVCDSQNNCVTKNVNLTVKDNYSSKSSKESDLKIDHIEGNYTDFDNKLFLKFSKAVLEDDILKSSYASLIEEMEASDFSNYLDDSDKDKQIVSSEIIYVYNKYNYVLGCAVRVKLSNGEYRYLTK